MFDFLPAGSQSFFRFHIKVDIFVTELVQSKFVFSNLLLHRKFYIVLGCASPIHESLNLVNLIQVSLDLGFILVELLINMLELTEVSLHFLKTFNLTFYLRDVFLLLAWFVLLLGYINLRK